MFTSKYQNMVCNNSFWFEYHIQELVLFIMVIDIFMHLNLNLYFICLYKDNQFSRILSFQVMLNARMILDTEKDN